MVAAPDTFVVTAPENAAVSIDDVLITPTGGVQGRLADKVAAAGGIGSLVAGANITITNPIGPTTTIAAAAGGITSIIAQGGPFLANGTITTTGTISNSTTALTAHGIVLGEGSSAVAVTAAMTNGQLLIGATGADPVPQTISGDATINAGGTITVTKIGGLGTLIAGGISNTASSQAIAAVPYSLPTFTTWLNQGTAVATVNANGPIVLSLATPAAANNIRSRYMALGAGDFSLTMQADLFEGPDATNCPTFGPILTDGTKTAIFMLAYSRTTPIVAGHVWNNVNTLSISLFGSDIAYGHLPPRLWQRISLSGTTYTCSLSMDGFAFNQVGPTFTAATVGFTPTGIGIGLEESSTSAGTGPFSMSLNYWLKTP